MAAAAAAAAAAEEEEEARVARLEAEGETLAGALAEGLAEVAEKRALLARATAELAEAERRLRGQQALAARSDVSEDVRARGL